MFDNSCCLSGVAYYATVCLLFTLCSCGVGSTSIKDRGLTAVKQKQKIIFLHRKLEIAEKEQKKINNYVERLSDEVKDAELAYIRNQIDAYEEFTRSIPSKRNDFARNRFFFNEREKLRKMIESGNSTFEAQAILDRILQLSVNLESDE